MRRPEPWQEDSLAMTRPDRRLENRRRRQRVRVSLRDYSKRELGPRRPRVVSSGMNNARTDWESPTLQQFCDSMENVAGRLCRDLRVRDQEDGSFLVTRKDTGAKFSVSWCWDDEVGAVTPCVSHGAGQSQVAYALEEAARDALGVANS